MQKGLSHATARLGFAPHVGLGHLVDTSLSIAEKELCNAPNGNTRDAPYLALVWPCSPRLPGGNRRRSDLSSLYSPCTFTERMGCVHATSTCPPPMTGDRRSSIGLCMIRDNHSIGIRNIRYLKTPTTRYTWSSNDNVKP